MNAVASGLVELIESAGYQVVVTAGPGIAVAGATSTDSGGPDLHIAGGPDEVSALAKLAETLGFTDLD